MLWLEGKKLSTVDKDRVYEYTFSPLTKAYWQKKHNLTPRLITAINWEACEDAMGRLPFGKNAGLSNMLLDSVASDDASFCGAIKITPTVLNVETLTSPGGTWWNAKA